MRIYRWRQRGSLDGNFGDEISIPIVERLFGIEARPSSMLAAELLAAGSILDAWTNSGRKRRYGNRLLLRRSRDLHVWGTGLLVAQKPSWPQRLHIHAVRGELTAQQVGIRPVLGDPGILASLLVQKPKHKVAAVAVVPNHVDVNELSTSLELPRDWRLIRPDRDVDTVLREIAGCELVVSSSLHGLITADSFGIPCVWLSTAKPLAGSGTFKFHDYETSRDARLNDPVDYDSICSMAANEIEQIASTCGRSIDEWQKGLIDAFPFR